MTQSRAFAVLAATGVLAAPAHSWAQQLGGGGQVEISWVRLILALVVCLGAAGLAIWLLRQRSTGSGLTQQLRGRFGASARIETIETRRISPHADLCLVRCDGVEYLLVCTAGNAELL